MAFILSTAALGSGITFVCLLLACLLVRHGGWDRALGLVLAMVVSMPIAFLFLPGWFSPEEDIANGLLAFMALFRMFWFWVTAAICSLVLYAPVRDLADRIRPPRPPVQDVFE